MRLILSRKGFDSSSGGCPSPIFSDGSMIALPIPDKRSPIRYGDLVWRGRNLGDIVSTLTRGKQRADYRAHLDPDLRRDLLPRHAGWRAALGQHAAAQGHLRNQGVGVGDLFLFWGLFQAVDADLRWVGWPEHHIWGWLQVGAVVKVDADVRTGGLQWEWAHAHPHYWFPPHESNTLYVAADRLSLPHSSGGMAAGFGTFEVVSPDRRLTAVGATSPLDWALPGGFLPQGRTALSHHDDDARWALVGTHAHLRAVSRGQEFVLDLDEYPELSTWLNRLIG